MSASEPQPIDTQTSAVHAAVRESRIFSSLHDSEIAEIVRASEVSRVAAGEVVCRPGDPGDHVAMVVSGCLVAEADGRCRITPLNRIGPGEIFGEMAVLRGARRSARVTAVEPSELLIICQAVFLSLLVRHPAVSIRILGSVSDRLHRLTEAVGEGLVTATL
jgi:CRP-like cAMP-binding protein